MKASENCDIIVHTASPFPLENPKDDNELIKPAVEGTLTILQAAQKQKVKRVVLTSSVATIYSKKDKSQRNFNDTDWSDLEACNAYYKSKTLAEQAAWKFVQDLPSDEKFELVTICPGLVMGPNINHC
mmetsp:Transcript_40378/g.62101  ORF Transcript_40378/g.62101 Transcript_40378/m.62101 type:complete len:128 (-) Transcript_40378:439-822(-)